MKRENAVSQKEESILAELHSAQREAISAIGCGKHTIEELDRQEEILDHVEDTLEANDIILDKSMKALRGMSWSGYFYNAVSGTAEYLTGNANSKADGSENVSNKCAAAAAVLSTPDAYRHRNPAPVQEDRRICSAESSLPVQCGDNQPSRLYEQNRNQLLRESSTSNTYTNSSGSLRNGGSSFSSSYLEAEQKHLDDIAASVQVMHQMGLTMNEQLGSQINTIDRIETVSDRVSDRTLAVTLKASQLNDRTRRQKPRLQGTYQFIDLNSGLFLAATPTNEVILSPLPTRAAYFKCFVRESSIVGLQNEKTLKFIGCSVLGGVVASTEYFGKYEECYLDFTGSSSSLAKGHRNTNRTGICFLARNWGSGGWLKAAPPISSSSASANGMHGAPSSMDAQSGSGQQDRGSSTSSFLRGISSSFLAASTLAGGDSPSGGPGPLTVQLTSTTSSIADKEGMIEFKAIHIADDKEKPID